MTEDAPRAQPPRWAERLLGLLVGVDDRNVVLEELSELYEIQCARGDVARARRWYVRQVAAFAWQLARHGRRRGVREGRSRFQAAMRRRGDEGRGGGMAMSELGTELTTAARRLRRAPVFTSVAVLTIAVAIGAFTSIFGLVEALLIEPPPYDEPDELAWVWRDYVEASFPRGWLGGPDIAGMMEHPDVFEEVVAFRTAAFNLVGTDVGPPVEVEAHLVSAGLFDMLGVPLLLGRDFRPEEDLPDGPRVAVLSHDLWQSYFGGRTNIIGRTIMLDDRPTEVVGVAPARFRFVKHGSLVDPVEADLYLPLQFDLAAQDPGSGAFAALVRIDPTAHPDRVAAALEAAAEATNAFFTQVDASPVRLWTIRLAEDLVAEVRPALIALTASAAFLLLILAANLAALLLSRAATREHELGIRIALGAGGGRILSSVIAESAALAAVGGVLGVGLAIAGTDVVVALAPDDLPRLHAVGLDGSVLAVAMGVTAGMALAAGLTPALYSVRSSIGATIGEGSARAGGSARRTRARSALVAVQVALSLMLLVGAGLTARAFAGLLREDPGFDAESTLTFRVPLPETLYGDAEQLAFHDALRESIGALPGVTAVGGTTALPLTLRTNQRGISFPGAPGNTGDNRLDSPLTDNFRVTPGYFTASGHRLLAGRDFGPLDADSATMSIVIDDVLADRFFPDGDAIGAQASFIGDTATIVGVVDQARLYSVHADDRGQVYLAFQRYPTSSLSYAVRTAGDPLAAAPAIRALLRELDPTVPMAQVRTLEQIVEESLGAQRLSLTLIVAFALGALLLAALGIYGVVANSVTRRTQEIGVRMALGAGANRVLRLVLGQGLRLCAVGAAIGLVGAVASARVVEGVMVGVDPSDPLVYVGVALGLVGVATLASYLPARRATQIDPLEALKAE